MNHEAFILPSRIPWETLKGKELEECVYWLLHAMGARDLQWRVGGTGDGAADQGRDLEATFFSADPSGEMIRQTWWVEAKGRTGSVEKRAVTDAVHNASSSAAVDVLVVATNTRFTNPTIDWASAWNANHVRPKVRLWDCSTLERHLSANPGVVARLFAEALSPSGRLEYVRGQYWNYSQLANVGDLKKIWRARAELAWTPPTLVAVIMSEISNGDVNQRAWAAAFPENELYAAFAISMANGPYLLDRANRMGGSFEYYTAAAAYLLFGLLLRYDAAKVAVLVEKVWDVTERSDWPDAVKKIFLDPTLNHLESDLFDLCMQGCHRINTDPRMAEIDRKHYMQRFIIRDDETDASEDEKRLIIESTKLACGIGLQRCGYFDPGEETLAQRIAKMHATARSKYTKATAKSSFYGLGLDVE